MGFEGRTEEVESNSSTQLTLNSIVSISLTRLSNRSNDPLIGSKIRWFFCSVIKPFFTSSPRARSRVSWRSSFESKSEFEWTSERIASRISWLLKIETKKKSYFHIVENHFSTNHFLSFPTPVHQKPIISFPFDFRTVTEGNSLTSY